ncbi:MAG: glycosyltransferase [Eubacterium sp.]|nr:glycosyltransferase [Eubacterium sp.]
MSKRVLFVINTLGHAGAETALLELLERLKDGCEIDLYVLLGQGEMVAKLPPGVHLLNRRFNDCSVLSARGRLHMAGTVMKAFLCRAAGIRLLPYLCRNFLAMLGQHRVQADKLLWRVLSDGGMRLDQEYDLAVAFIEGGSAYYVADHVKARKKAAFIHIDYEQAGYTRELDRDCYLQFDAIFPIAEEIRHRLLKVYPECADRTRVFHNMINRDRILGKAKEGEGFKDGYQGTRILTVGRLTRQKAYPVAIEAMKLLKAGGCRARWYVLGEGEERRALEKKIGEYGLEEDFVLMGAVENPFPYYKQTDLYVHATGFEGKSIAIQEAQILGCAIIASDCTGNREQIVHGTDGLLCDLSPQAVKDAVLRLIEDSGLREKLKHAAACKRITYEEDIGLLTEILDSD